MAWFKDWFNSPYYHILYGSRDEAEANQFIQNIADLLQFKKGELALDLACGKGRHSRELASHSLNVYGIDLSEESIKAASQMSSENLQFEIHDMRKVFKKNYFDYVFNLFTSFGYFPNIEDNLMTLRAVRENLKEDGIFVQDYFNAPCVISRLIPSHQQTIDGITFHIEKRIADHKIYKSIQFSHLGEDYEFTEEVSLFTLADFEAMYKSCGLIIKAVYGDYELQPFNPDNSGRIVLISTPI